MLKLPFIKIHVEKAKEQMHKRCSKLDSASVLKMAFAVASLINFCTNENTIICVNKIQTSAVRII